MNKTVFPCKIGSKKDYLCEDLTSPMKKIVLLLVLLVSCKIILTAQEADSLALPVTTDTVAVLELTPINLYQPVYNSTDKYLNQGDKVMDYGWVHIATGGGIVLAGCISIGIGLVQGVYMVDSGNVGGGIVSAILFYMAGISGIALGSLWALSGVPIVMAGYGINKCPGYWQDARFSGDAQRGFSLILEGGPFAGYPTSGIDAHITGGYNLDHRFFFGAGVAPTLYFHSVNSVYTKTLPVYADARASIGDGLFSPYIGGSIGMDTLNPSLYYSIHAGLRIRMSQDLSRSFWTSLRWEDTRATGRQLGFNIGYSF